MYITPFITARMSVRRLPPPDFAGGMSGSTYAHSSSVRSLGYLRLSRLYFGRFSCVHIGGTSPNQAASFESQLILLIPEDSRRTLSALDDPHPAALGVDRRGLRHFSRGIEWLEGD